MSDQPTGKRPKNCNAVKNSPYWQYEYSFKGHVDRGSTGCRSASEATEWVESRKVEFRAEINAKIAGENGEVKRKKITVMDACERYRVDRLPQNEEDERNWPGLRSWRNVRFNLTQFVLFFGPDKLVSAITKADWINYRNHRQRQPNRYGGKIAGSTINREIECAARIWKHSHDVGFEVGNAVTVTTSARDTSQERTVIRALSESEETRLMAALEKEQPELALLCEFAKLCGQRQIQVIELKRSMVDFDTKRATIMLKRRGQPAPHVFPLSPRMLEIIAAFPELPGHDRVFSYVCRRARKAREGFGELIKGERYPFSRQNWRDYWYRALKAAKIEDFRFHDLRHTCATRVTRKGGLAVASKLLGHANVQTTMRYAHVLNSDVEAALLAVEAA